MKAVSVAVLLCLVGVAVASVHHARNNRAKSGGCAVENGQLPRYFESESA
jgi:hypothetical protein